MYNFIEKGCPKCGSMRRKKWSELDAEELLLIKKLPGNRVFSEEERKQHEFCGRCWYEFSRDGGFPVETRT
ncbi:MAG: hypothetical protein KDB79_08280 [Acidobacteria bacterium]|nr:hypothetical protein [Acidobacteriota bacterium]